MKLTPGHKMILARKFMYSLSGEVDGRRSSAHFNLIIIDGFPCSTSLSSVFVLADWVRQ